LLRSFPRSIHLGLHLAKGVVWAGAIFPFMPWARRRPVVGRWCRKLVSILGLRLEVRGDATAIGPNTLIVSNHISWVDIMAINGVRPACFVSKSEISDWPVVGWLAKETGTLFIERDKRHDAGRVGKQMTRYLNEGEVVAIFPEGTTSDGSHLRRFFASLLQPAIAAHATLQPLAIEYLNPDGSRSLAPAYIDDMSFGESLKRIFAARGITVRISVLDPIEVDGRDRRTLARRAHDAIATCLGVAPLGKEAETHVDLPDARPSSSPPTDSPYPAPSGRARA
jgi:1-acyl-sn-glycerol-3-phosphate acyltransferase